MSRAGFPKQFLVLSGTTSLFQQAVERVNQLGAAYITVGNTLVVTNEERRFLSIEQLREIKGVNATLLLEPTGRNTFPHLLWQRCKPPRMVKTLFLWQPQPTKPCKIPQHFSKASVLLLIEAAAFCASPLTSSKQAMATFNSPA